MDQQTQDEDVVDPWVVLRRLMAENHALKSERDDLVVQRDELASQLAALRSPTKLQSPPPTSAPPAAEIGRHRAPTPTRRSSPVTPVVVAVRPQPAEQTPRTPSLPDLEVSLRSWQRDALATWSDAGHRGVVEAVTGAGKTFVGMAAARDALAAGGRVVVLVPTIELQEQWARALMDTLPDADIGRLGGGRDDELADCHVLVALVQSASRRTMRARPGDLLVADECHRYGTPVFAAALEDGFDRRLGFTATFEREDDGVDELLLPYFGRVVFQLWYDRALADGVIAQFEIALVGVDLTGLEQQGYDACTDKMDQIGRALQSRFGIPREPHGMFMAALNRLAHAPSDPASKTARGFLAAMTERRRLLAASRSKVDVLSALEPVVRSAQGALVFTQTKESAENAAGLFGEAGIPAAALYSGLDRDERRSRMDAFRTRTSQLLAAPRILDEGVDVPEADLAIIVAGTRSKRQLVQRLGRVLRPKADGRHARLVMLYAAGTVEDPTLFPDSPLVTVLPHGRRRGDFALPRERDGLLAFLLGEDWRADLLPVEQPRSLEPHAGTTLANHGPLTPRLDVPATRGVDSRPTRAPGGPKKAPSKKAQALRSDPAAILPAPPGGELATADGLDVLTHDHVDPQPRTAPGDAEFGWEDEAESAALLKVSTPGQN